MTPTSTYRLQINPAFDLHAATSTVDYLARLGVGAVYTSPLLAAAPGSTHGYDVVDPTRANPELGGEEGRVSLMSTARAAGLGVVVDVVPNHMSVAVPKANPWWWDVLKNGRASKYSTYFDIDWSKGPILLPILGSDSLEDLKLTGDRLTYHEHEFPVAPGTTGGTPSEVHSRQHYRLIWWRRGNAELTYRRFFDITTLAGVRVEDPAVFESTHAEILRWVAAGDVTGLRIDHPDGLSDPGAYLRRLRSRAPNIWLVTEKILSPEESQPTSWPAEGTVGYDALREICGLFINPAGEAPMTALATQLGLQTTPTNPTTTPSEATATPADPTATPANPTTTPANPTTTPTNPTATPADATSTPGEPTTTPSEAATTPANPTTTPTDATSTPDEPTSTPATPAARTATPASAASTPGEPTSTPANPTSTPTDTTATPDEPTPTPTDPATTPTDANFTPGEPATTAFEPTTAPANPTTASGDPATTPAEAIPTPTDPGTEPGNPAPEALPGPTTTPAAPRPASPGAQPLSRGSGGLRPPGIQSRVEDRQDPSVSGSPVDNSVESAPFAGRPVDNSSDEPFSSVPSGTLDTGGRRPNPALHAVEEECRRLITRTSLVAEMRRIAALAGVPPEAVAEIMIGFPVYRSYLPEGLEHWAAAVAAAKRARPDLARHVDTVDRMVRAEPRGELATRMQQTSGMVVAKGVEDTAFYRWTPFVALNEVGGTPDRFGVTPAEFHARAAAREAGWPATMTALSTHDTKRAEDVRARLAVLSEIPGEWAETVTRWTASHGIAEPSLNLLAWQSIVGAWPISADRLRGYLDKAAKEAKIRTSWVDHDEDFEKAVNAWPDTVIDELGDEIDAFVARIRPAGWSNSLGQKLVQLAGPGVPDVYQGTELFDLSLVDPDNRRPVDFDLRRELLARLESGWLPDVDDTGAAKLHVVRQVLYLRRDRPDLFTGYRPLRAQGPAADHVVAFHRRPELVVVATRLPMSVGDWRDTVLPLPAGQGDWHDLLTGTTIDTGAEPRRAVLGDLLSRYPVALLLRGDR